MAFSAVSVIRGPGEIAAMVVESCYGDPARFPRFFVYLNLFLAAMLIPALRLSCTCSTASSEPELQR